MTRVSRRRIERGLRLPAPAPPADLARRIKDQIPDDLFGAPDDPSRRDLGSGTPLSTGAARPRALTRSAAWAVAASLMVAIGAGWLAVRLFETGDPLSPARVATTPAEQKSAPRAIEPAIEPMVNGAAGQAAQPSAPLEVAASERNVRAPTRRDRSEHQAELLEKESAPAPATPPSAPQPAVQAPESRVEALAPRERSNAGELGDAAADRPSSPPSLALSLDRTSDVATGRVVLLVIATAPMVDATGNPALATDAIELDLDHALVTGHRLLASHSSDLDVDAATAAAPPATASRQVIALYELEVAAELERNAVLGTARLRDDGAAEDLLVSGLRKESGRREESTRRKIVAADVAGDGVTAAVSLRLAARADDAALPPENVSPASVASLRAEIERLRAASEVDEATARRAIELLDVVAR